MHFTSCKHRGVFREHDTMQEPHSAREEDNHDHIKSSSPVITCTGDKCKPLIYMPPNSCCLPAESLTEVTGHVRASLADSA